MTQTFSQSNQEKDLLMPLIERHAIKGNVARSVPYRVKDLQRLVEVGEWQTWQMALDIATGEGKTARTVAPYVGRMMAVDLDLTNLERACKYIQAQGIRNADFQVADAEKLPFAANAFDRVTCRSAAHYFADVDRSVQEVARVLRPGGLFLLIDSCAPEDTELDQFINSVEKRRDCTHQRSYTQAEWQRLFSQAGLEVEHTETFRRSVHYNDWVARLQLSSIEKFALEKYILGQAEDIQHYFEVKVRDDGHLQSFSSDILLLKGRKLA